MNRKVQEKIRFNPYKEITGDTDYKVLLILNFFYSSHWCQCSYFIDYVFNSLCEH